MNLNTTTHPGPHPTHGGTHLTRSDNEAPGTPRPEPSTPHAAWTPTPPNLPPSFLACPTFPGTLPPKHRTCLLILKGAHQKTSTILWKTLCSRVLCHPGVLSSPTLNAGSPFSCNLNQAPTVFHLKSNF